MARLIIAHPGLNNALKHLRVQVIDSMPWTVRNLPRFNSLPELFSFCKSKYTFQDDPNGVELFQTVPTLLEENEHGPPGHGDCDDATIFVLTLLLLSGYDCGIVLAGRSKYNASHIYAYADEKGRRYYLDLTNPKFNQTRPYPFFQEIPFKISKNQLDMFLQLADGNQRRRCFQFKKLSPEQKKNSVYFPSKKVFLPVETVDRMPVRSAVSSLLNEGYDPEQLSEYLAGRKQRRAERQEQRKQRRELKTEKKRQQIEAKKARTEIKKARAEKKRAKGEAAKTKAEAKYRKAEREEESPWKTFTKTAGEVVQNIFRPEEEEPEEVEAEEMEQEEAETEETELNEGPMTGTEILTLVITGSAAFAEKKFKL
jgi:hypothetical protein